LTRGEIEWLALSGTPPLDLRGADLANRDLTGIALPGARFGLDQDEWLEAINARLWEAAARGAFEDDLPDDYLSIYRAAAASLDRAFVDAADVHGATLNYASLKGASLYGANMRSTQLVG